MGLIRGVARGIVALVSLVVGLAVLVPVLAVLAGVGLPILIILTVAAALGAGGMVLAGLPVILAIVLIAVAVAVLAALVAGAITFGVFALKVLLFLMLLSWLARVLMGWGQPSRSRTELKGDPVVDIPAPGLPVRDKYQVAAERELDKELGF